MSIAGLRPARLAPARDMAGDDFPSPDDAATRRNMPDDRETVRGLLAGQRVFGRFVLEAVVGRGGMGVVWRAHDTTLGETVALKFLPEVVARDAVAIDELKEETRRARRLTHPHIVRIHDFVQDEQHAAVSMEYVLGRTLAQQQLEQPGKVLAVATLAPLVAQLCAALDYAHGEAKVVHRDLKPANLLVTDDGRLKVTDFGIARSLSGTQTRRPGQGSGDTSGTLLYMSPQQLAGDKPTAADDIYSLGATLYDLLTSKPPFYTGGVSHQILQTAPAGLAARRLELGLDGGAIPPQWEQTILACLAKEPADRPPTAGEVNRRLQAGGHREDAGPVAAGVSPRLAQPAKSRWPLYLGLAVTAVAALAAVLFRQFNSPGAAPAGTSAANVSPPQIVPPVIAPGLAREFVVTVDPVDAGARIWLGPQSNVATAEGRAVLKDLPDGEHRLTVRAAGYQPFTTLVTVQHGRGRAEARLLPEKVALETTARPGTIVTALDDHSRTTRLGVVPDSGTLVNDNLLPPGTYTLRFEHPDLDPVELKNVELPGGRTTKVTAPRQAVSRPDLKSIPVIGYAQPITNARVESVTPNGISFVCDQGLREIPFNSLPPGFRAYYSQFVKAPPNATDPRYPGPTKPGVADKRWPADSRGNDPALSDAEKMQQRAARRNQLKQTIELCERRINYYLRQSYFKPGGPTMTEEEYRKAKMIMEEAKRQLDALGDY